MQPFDSDGHESLRWIGAALRLGLSLHTQCSAGQGQSLLETPMHVLTHHESWMLPKRLDFGLTLQST